MRIVFDLDDTIQLANYRDYATASPIWPVIQRMREAKAQGAEVVISTARGMLSCNGDGELADKKNRPIIEEWLKRYNVPCDELRFGKPMADAYVDDKAVTVQEFIDGRVDKMCGYSGSSVWRVGNKVQKYAKDSDRVAFWYKQAASISSNMFKVPQVYSYRVGNIQLEYIDGQPIYKNINKTDIDALCDILRLFGRCRVLDNNYDDYVAYISERCSDEVRGIYEKVEKECKKTAEPLFCKGTFCHGDFSTFNIIRDGSEVYLIDPSVRCWNSWLLDAAKLRASLSGLGKVLGDEHEHVDILEYFDEHFTAEENTAIRFLELTQYIRVLPYAKNVEDALVLEAIIKERWL